MERRRRWWLAALVALAMAACSDSSGGGYVPSPGGGDADASGDVSGQDVAAGDALEDTLADAPAPDAESDATTDAGEDDAAGVADAGPDAIPDGGDDAPDAIDEVDSVPDPDVTASFGHCSEPGGDRNIYDLQNPDCPDHISPEPVGNAGVDLTIRGVVVTAVYGDTLFVQEPTGGPYSGLAVFTHGIGTELVRGDLVDVTGSYSEFFDNTQLYLEDWEVHGQQDLPAPFVAEHPEWLATGGALAEMYEGVLVRVEDVETIHTKPDCPHDFGEFTVTGGLRVDDKGYAWDPHLGDEFASITGPLHYGFGNFKLEPRDESDLDVVIAGGQGAISKCIEGECIEPATAAVSRRVIVSEVMADPYGEDTAQEWIELHNPGPEPVDLNGWTLRDCAVQEQPLAGDGLVIEPGGFLVVGDQDNESLNGGVPVDLVWSSTYHLPNTIGAVLLYDASDTLVDQMRYSAFDPDQNLFVGHSMERVSPDSDGTKVDSWHKATYRWGDTENRGTPGFE
ncbi:MAG: lamin tail domain-containing protein [Myxococcota bacterium]